MSLKGANSPMRGRKLRSTGTKTRAHVSDEPNSLIELKKQLEARTHELAEAQGQLSEALKQQTATSQVLRVISSSPGELQRVLDAVGENAARLCDANNAVIFRLEGDLLRQVASYGGLPTTSHPAEGLPVNRGRVTGRAVFERRTIHVHDLAAEEDDFPQGSRDARRDGHRTTLATPLLREGVPIGAILIRRMEVRPFSEKQIALLGTFADQAAIAIENARLFEAEQQRTRELSEALEHQTATSEVLNVITRSPTDAQPVFDAIVQSAARLCEAMFSLVFLYDGDLLRLAATHNFTPEVLKKLFQTYPKRPDRSVLAGRAVLDGRIAHVPDLLADREYSHQLALAGNWRAGLAVPMLRDGKPVGAISVARAEPVPFSDRQIQLLTTFAEQAVIAIENVRLFEAEQERTRELSESLEQQTATSEVLRVISSSPGELEPVFQAMLENATRICTAKFGLLWRIEDGAPRIISKLGIPPALAEYLQPGPHRPPLKRPGPLTAISRVIKSRQTIHIADYRTDQSVLDRDPLSVAGVELGGIRTLLVVPMLKDDALLGAIGIYRQEVRPFTDKQIELVENFASQAVIAIENTRLLNELRESLQQQTATSEVLQVISSSPGELQPVFDAMLANATRICDAKFGTLYLRDE
ncbi:MAG TPA: GAF domain-containing protein, partial [Pseudolabrys sp.]|nr:GAF domain-containing protein [Pseudolabrys sp.]